MRLTEEDAFDFIENDEGKMLMVIEAREDEPADPVLYFDGEITGALVRSPDETIRLPMIPAAVGERLDELPTILVSEVTEDGDIAFVYEVAVNIIDTLPNGVASD